MLSYSLGKNWVITFKRKSKRGEYEKKYHTGGYIACVLQRLLSFFCSFSMCVIVFVYNTVACLVLFAF